MRLKRFRVTDYRSINDSGWIDAEKLTCLVGRNESGKSNILRALGSLNPPGGMRALDPVKDFPNHRRLNECKPHTVVLKSEWTLGDDERAKLTSVWPRGAQITHVELRRTYKGTSPSVTFWGASQLSVSADKCTELVRKVRPAVQSRIDQLDDGNPKSSLEKALGEFVSAFEDPEETAEWGGTASDACEALRTAMAGADKEFTPKAEECFDELDAMATEVKKDRAGLNKGADLVRSWLPTFVFLEDYPELPGHQNIAEYLARKSSEKLTEADRNFEKLCKVAGLDPQLLHKLMQEEDHEQRNQLANRASAQVTQEIRRLWTDRPLKVRINLDQSHTDTLISDPNAVFEVEVNLNDRSRGFNWFFSFFITFAADTQGGPSEKAIILLDEPGLFLHAASQRDLLNFLKEDLDNQVIYTTHSPFMVPSESLEAVRTVNISPDDGTTVSNDPTGDAKTLFPIQSALGYTLAQSLFVGPANLVVEGVTDFWYLSSISENNADLGARNLDSKIAITPAGGAQKVTYMVALLTSQDLGVVVLLDDEKRARATSDELVKSKLISNSEVLFTSAAFDKEAPSESDIEDLLDQSVFEALVAESYASELSGKSLKLNENIPRIVKRYEAAFESMGLEFHKTRPAKLFLTKMGEDPDSVMGPDARERFERLFEKINEAHSKQRQRAEGSR